MRKEGPHCGDDVEATRGAAKVRGIARDDRHRQYQQRDDADHMGRQQVIEREAEPGHTRRHGAREKQGCPSLQPLSGERPYRTMNPEPIPTRLSTTCTMVNVRRLKITTGLLLPACR